MDVQKILDQVSDNLETVLKEDSPLGVLLWQEFVKLHPADIAQYLSDTSKESARGLFLKLPYQLRVAVFHQFSSPMMVTCLYFLPNNDRSELLSSLPLDELTDFFDDLSNEELKRYLKLLHKKDRENVVSMLKFDPDSAGGIMHTDVVTLMKDFTIEKALQILQRLQPRIELHPQIYVTTQDNQLVGHINIEDLVLKPPKTRISSIVRKDEYVAAVDEDQEKVAHNMVHYNLMTVPVASDSGVFLGVIPSEALIEILEQEAAEDVYKISGMTPIKYAYFETPFIRLMYKRTSILVVLLLLQTFSTMIMEYYNTLLIATSGGFLALFLTMIQSTGGNTSSQSSALAIQGISSGEISESNMVKFVRREMLMSIAIGVILASVSFLRTYVQQAYLRPGGEVNYLGNMAVSVSLGVIVLVSTLLGSLIPVVLRRLNMDPATSAGPFLATLMDILGLLIYCYVGSFFLG